MRQKKMYIYIEAISAIHDKQVIPNNMPKEIYNEGTWVVLMYGITTVFCVRCENKRSMYGWMPIARQIWHNDEGLECCNIQTVIISQEERKE